MSKKTKAPKDATTSATLNSEQYNTLLRLIQSVELKRIEYQQALDALMDKRNTYYAQIAAQYHLPPTFSAMAWDDDTLQVTVTP
jgi:hypothetical protein